MAEPDDDPTAADALRPIRRGGFRAALRARWPVALALVWAALAAADIAFLHTGPGSGHAAASATATPRVAASSHAPGARGSHPAHARTPAPGHPAAPAELLVPVSATAIGLGGPGTGDNPGTAGLAIDASTATAWTSDWYRTPQFGGLQSGTGLLIDMGQPVSITRVRIVLGSALGADLQIVTGNGPALAGRQPSASASDAGGTVSLKVSSATPARYLLVWFTQLPPNSTGTFQASVYDISIFGTP